MRMCAHGGRSALPSMPGITMWILAIGLAATSCGGSSNSISAARCAGDSRYFAVLDVIYRSQATWAGASDAWAAMQKVLRDAGMAQSLLDACAANAALEQGVMAIRQEGIDAYGVTATPTFIVNGNRVVGNVPLAALTSYFK